jgi:hypothetical protein
LVAKACWWAADCCGAVWLKNGGASILVKFKWCGQLARTVWWPELSKVDAEEGAEERTFRSSRHTLVAEYSMSLKPGFLDMLEQTQSDIS